MTYAPQQRHQQAAKGGTLAEKIINLCWSGKPFTDIRIEEEQPIYVNLPSGWKALASEPIDLGEMLSLFAQLDKDWEKKLEHGAIDKALDLTQHRLRCNFFLADGGRVVNLSSGLSRFSFPGYAAYAVMKGGIEVLTRYLAKELGPRGITVNAVAPGAIETDFGGGVIRDNAGLNKMIAAQTALGRVGLPEDIGPLIAALLSESGRWVNGQRIEVSGGMLL